MPTSTLTFKQVQDFLLDKDFARRTRSLSDSYDVTTVANQVSYSIIDAKFYHISHVRYIEDSSTEYGVPLRRFPGGFSNLPKEMNWGIPYYFWDRYGGDNTVQEIGTFPIASTSSYTITVWGFDLPANLTADGNVPVIHEAYHEALILYPLWKICNAYAHKSKAIREKGVVARDEYLEMVRDARVDNEGFLSEDDQTIDVYSGSSEDLF
jgi:hypothetical protein